MYRNKTITLKKFQQTLDIYFGTYRTLIISMIKNQFIEDIFYQASLNYNHNV